MAFTQADLDAVRAAIAKGEQTVAFADRSVTYRSMKDLFDAEARINQALNAGTARAKQSLTITCKGF